MLARLTGRATYHRALGVKLTEGTVSTDLLVAYTPFFFFFFLTQHIWDKGAGPKVQAGALTNSKRARSCARNPTLTGFLERTQTL